jgi:hypothetical protein
MTILWLNLIWSKNKNVENENEGVDDEGFGPHFLSLATSYISVFLQNPVTGIIRLGRSRLIWKSFKNPQLYIETNLDTISQVISTIPK